MLSLRKIALAIVVMSLNVWADPCTEQQEAFMDLISKTSASRDPSDQVAARRLTEAFLDEHPELAYLVYNGLLANNPNLALEFKNLFLFRGGELGDLQAKPSTRPELSRSKVVRSVSDLNGYLSDQQTNTRVVLRSQAGDVFGPGYIVKDGGNYAFIDLNGKRFPITKPDQIFSVTPISNRPKTKVQNKAPLLAVDQLNGRTVDFFNTQSQQWEKGYISRSDGRGATAENFFVRPIGPDGKVGQPIKVNYKNFKELPPISSATRVSDSGAVGNVKESFAVLDGINDADFFSYNYIAGLPDSEAGRALGIRRITTTDGTEVILLPVEANINQMNVQRNGAGAAITLTSMENDSVKFTTETFVQNLAEGRWISLDPTHDVGYHGVTIPFMDPAVQQGLKSMAGRLLSLRNKTRAKFAGEFDSPTDRLISEFSSLCDEMTGQIAVGGSGRKERTINIIKGKIKFLEDAVNEISQKYPDLPEISTMRSDLQKLRETLLKSKFVNESEVNFEISRPVKQSTEAPSLQVKSNSVVDVNPKVNDVTDNGSLTTKSNPQNQQEATQTVVGSTETLLRTVESDSLVVDRHVAVINDLNASEEALIDTLDWLDVKIREAPDSKKKTLLAISDSLRIRAAEKIMGFELQGGQAEALILAHRVGENQLGRNGKAAGKGNYTLTQLKEKIKLLRKANFTKDQIKALLKKGIAGEAIPDDLFAQAEVDIPKTNIKPDELNQMLAQTRDHIIKNDFMKRASKEDAGTFYTPSAGSQQLMAKKGGRLQLVTLENVPGKDRMTRVEYLDENGQVIATAPNVGNRFKVAVLKDGKGEVNYSKVRITFDNGNKLTWTPPDGKLPYSTRLKLDPGLIENGVYGGHTVATWTEFMEQYRGDVTAQFDRPMTVTVGNTTMDFQVVNYRFGDSGRMNTKTLFANRRGANAEKNVAIFEAHMLKYAVDAFNNTPRDSKMVFVDVPVRDTSGRDAFITVKFSRRADGSIESWYVVSKKPYYGQRFSYTTPSADGANVLSFPVAKSQTEVNPIPVPAKKKADTSEAPQGAEPYLYFPDLDGRRFSDLSVGDLVTYNGEKWKVTFKEENSSGQGLAVLSSLDGKKSDFVDASYKKLENVEIDGIDRKTDEALSALEDAQKNNASEADIVKAEANLVLRMAQSLRARGYMVEVFGHPTIPGGKMFRVTRGSSETTRDYFNTVINSLSKNRFKGSKSDFFFDPTSTRLKGAGGFSDFTNRRLVQGKTWSYDNVEEMALLDVHEKVHDRNSKNVTFNPDLDERQALKAISFKSEKDGGLIGTSDGFYDDYRRVDEVDARIFEALAYTQKLKDGKSTRIESDKLRAQVAIKEAYKLALADDANAEHALKSISRAGMEIEYTYGQGNQAKKGYVNATAKFFIAGPPPYKMSIPLKTLKKLPNESIEAFTARAKKRYEQEAFMMDERGEPSAVQKEIKQYAMQQIIRLRKERQVVIAVLGKHIAKGDPIAAIPELKNLIVKLRAGSYMPPQGMVLNAKGELVFKGDE